MMMCEIEDIKLAAQIIEAYNYNSRDDADPKLSYEKEMAIEEKTIELYGADEDSVVAPTIEVPAELFHRMTVEVEHHKAMLDGKGSGLVATFGASLTAKNEYGLSKDIRVTMNVKLRAPDAEDMNETSLEEVVACAVDGFRGTLVSEMNQLKAEIEELKSKLLNN